MHGSFANPRILECPCGSTQQTISRNAKLCSTCHLKRALSEPYGAALKQEKAA